MHLSCQNGPNDLPTQSLLEKRETFDENTYFIINIANKAADAFSHHTDVLKLVSEKFYDENVPITNDGVESWDLG